MDESVICANRLVDDGYFIFAWLIAVDRRNQTVLPGDGKVNGKLGEKWTGRDTRDDERERGGCRFGASLDYFAMVQSTPSDLYFR